MERPSRFPRCASQVPGRASQAPKSGSVPVASTTSRYSKTNKTTREELRMTEITRRGVAALWAAAAVHAFPGVSMAQGRRFAVASITGSWEVAFREILIPSFRAANNNPDVALDALIGLDQIAKVTASKGNPPLDTMLLDPRPALVAEGQGLVEHFPSERSAHYKDINPNARTRDGVAPFFIFIGLAYNTDKVKTPPTSWGDLWKPEYKGRVGI